MVFLFVTLFYFMIVCVKITCVFQFSLLFVKKNKSEICVISLL